MYQLVGCTYAPVLPVSFIVIFAKLTKLCFCKYEILQIRHLDNITYVPKELVLIMSQ